MNLIKGFYLYSNGKIEETWLAVDQIKGVTLADYYNNLLGKQISNVICCEMGTFSREKIAYIDLNLPVEIKSIQEVFSLANEEKPLSTGIKRRGRPSKQHSAIGA